MDSSQPVLVNTRGQPLTKETVHTTNGPFAPSVLGGGWNTYGDKTRLKGARPNPRQNDHRLYTAIYMQHPLVKAAIDKKVSVATNTGYEFIPRSRLQKEVPADQAKIVADFFDKQPNFMGQLRAAYLDMEIYGDGFLYVVPDRRRRPKRLKHLTPWTMHIKAKRNGEIEYYVQVVGDQTKIYKPHEIIHMRHINPEDDLYGLSRLEAIKNTIASDLYAESYNMNFFKNGASTGTMFVIRNASQQELELNRAWIREEYVGTSNAHKPIILAGDVDVKNSVASHQDMGYLEGRDQNKKVILAALDVPPAKIGDMESANRSNSKEQDKSFRTEAVMPLQYVVEQGISNFIRDVLGCPDVLFKHSSGDIRDAQEQMDLWVQAARMGFMSINEIRAMMGRVDIDGGDIHYVMTPTGAVPVVDLELYFTLASTNTDKIPPEMHNHDGNIEETHGPVGPNPKNVKNDVVTGSPPAIKSQGTQPPISLYSALQYIGQAANDETVLRHCYAYAVDAQTEVPSPYIDEAVVALRKARAVDDEPDLRLTYIERAGALLNKAKESYGT